MAPLSKRTRPSTTNGGMNMSKDEIQDLAKEMGDWGFTLVRNYATNEWEMLEDETGYFTYESWWSGEKLSDLKEHFNKAKAEHPDRYSPKGA